MRKTILHNEYTLSAYATPESFSSTHKKQTKWLLNFLEHGLISNGHIVSAYYNLNHRTKCESAF